MSFAVWCYAIDSRWFVPYSSKVSEELESALVLKKNLVPLGEIESHLDRFTVDMQKMTQVSNTGTERKIKRTIVDSSHPFSRGDIWEWSMYSDTWIPYGIDEAKQIGEEELLGRNCAFSLATNPRYSIDLSQNVQTNIYTNYQRQIRKRKVDPYPPVGGTVNSQPPKIAPANPTFPIQPSTSTTRPPKTNIQPFTNTTLANGITGNSTRSNTNSSNAPAPQSGASFANFNNQPLSSNRSTPVKGLGILTPFSTNSFSIPNPQPLYTFPTTSALLQNNQPSTNRTALPPNYPRSPLQRTGVSTPLSNNIHPMPSVNSLNINQTSSSALAGVSSQPNSSRSSSQLNSSLDMSGLIAKYCLGCDSGNFAQEICVICTEELSSPSSYDDFLPGMLNPVIKLSKCGHYFHNQCLNSMIVATKASFIKCPSCGERYGEQTGSQPEGGVMAVTVDDNLHLSGYEKYDTLVVTYNFTSGVSDGQPFSAAGFPRIAYFPDNNKGKKVVSLLKVAFRRRLVFRIGTSCTTGRNNCVIWNDIHHKTSANPGNQHGYPDPNYLDRVLEELKEQGVY